MGKKRHSFINAKLINAGQYSSPSGSSASNGRNGSPATVNEILTTLRTRPSNSETSRAAPAVVPSMPAEIRHLLDIPDTPIPRPRNRRARFDGEGRRLPAGPAPPRGWLDGSLYAPPKQQEGNAPRRIRNGVEGLPGVSKCPAKRSLVATCMRKISQNWSFHFEYDQGYLGTLPTELRMILLSYVASYGPEEGVGIGGLQTILLPGEYQVKDFGGNDDFHRVDLSGSMGRSISFRQLEKVIVRASTLNDEEEDWELAVSKLALSSAIASIPSDSLRFLSLANPAKNISWSAFLDFAAHVPLVTHLSLAGWQTPCLTPNSMKATMASRYGRNIAVGGSNYYSHTLDNDWSEAASILQSLSKSLYSLEWLDLDGCNFWTPALYWDAKPFINWAGPWRKVSFISLRSNTVPQANEHNTELYQYKKDVLRALTLEDHIRKIRGWITVEHDEWNEYDSLWEQDVVAATRYTLSFLREKLDHSNFTSIRDAILADEIMDRRRMKAAHRQGERIAEEFLSET